MIVGYCFIFDITLLGELVPNNIHILEPHCLPVDLMFYLIYTYLQGAICFYKNHGVINILHSINMEVLDINYSINGISIAYLFTSKVTLH